MLGNFLFIIANFFWVTTRFINLSKIKILFIYRDVVGFARTEIYDAVC
jgi:hypothetical protein